MSGFRFSSILVFISFLVVPYQLSAQEAFEYVPAAPLEVVQPSYPERAISRRLEGYVVYNFMIDTDGKAFDVITTESTDTLFETASMEALEQIRWTPAKLNGVAVDTSHSYKFTYRISDAQPERWFLLGEKDFGKALEEGDIEEAEEIFHELRERSKGNMYAIARVKYAEFFLAKARGDMEQQRVLLESALAYDKVDNDNADSKFESLQFSVMQKESLPAARAELFKIQALSKRFGDAMDTYEWIVRAGDMDMANTLRPFYEKFKAAAEDESEYVVEGRVHGPTWSIELHKRGFYFDQISGRIDELKLHCQTKSVLLTDISDKRYYAPESWGRCTLHVVADPETNFRFVQSFRGDPIAGT